MTNIMLGLATHRALVATFEPCRAWVDDEPDATERALYRARLAFIDSARVTKWKAYIPMPAASARVLLAEDLRGWAEPAGLIDEFETTRPNTLIRLAFINMARQLEEAAGALQGIAS